MFEVKADCDRNFEALTRRLLEARPAVRVAVASHNLRSVSHAIAFNRLAGGDDRDLELQVLRGLGDELQARWRPAAFASARTARSATWWREWPTWCGDCSRTRSNESFLYEQARGRAARRAAGAPRDARSRR